MSPIIAKSPSKKGKYEMRWDCERDGCFNQKMRPKWEVFEDCFPVGTFSDIDGAYERNGHLLLIEWKSPNVKLQLSQELMFKRATKISKVSVIVVNGNAETMEIFKMMTITHGKIQWERDATLDEFKALIRIWVEWAEKQPWRGGWL